LYFLMQAQLKGLESRRLLVLLAKIAAASAALITVCAVSSHWLLADWPYQALLPKIGALALTVIMGGAVFAGCGILLHIEELKELRAALLRRLRR
jgi:peptidoglycan biosynthesis protein MviN/MurJ (putative lipid II flippase)